MIELEIFESYIKVADIQAERLHSALTKIKNLPPLTSQSFLSLPVEEIGLFEIVSTRFCKLQDIIPFPAYDQTY